MAYLVQRRHWSLHQRLLVVLFLRYQSAPAYIIISGRHQNQLHKNQIVFTTESCGALGLAAADMANKAANRASSFSILLGFPSGSD